MRVVTEGFIPLTSLVIEVRLGAGLNDSSHIVTSLSAIVTSGAKGWLLSLRAW